MQSPNILLIGCGPHAKRVYLPILKETEFEFGTKLKAVVELKEKENDVSKFVNNFFTDVEFVYTEKFDSKYKMSIPSQLEMKLNRIVKERNINGVIIATDPLNHLQYALWAQKQKLHILMDKPISTYENISNSIKQARQLIRDYKILMKNYSAERAFIINAQRRFLQIGRAHV